MSSYIEVDHLKKSVEELQDCYNGFSDTYDKACIIGLIDEEPTADVVPVNHGHWEREIIKDNCGCNHCYYCCSKCGKASDDEFDYCQHCGAKMDESTMDQVKGVTE